jgi:hypothetical protein
VIVLTEVPGWWSAGILLPKKEAGMIPRDPEQSFLPAKIWPARIAEERRFAPGRRAQTEVWATVERVGRGVGQGYFALGAGGVGSIPTCAERFSSSLEERPGP